MVDQVVEPHRLGEDTEPTPAPLPQPRGPLSRALARRLRGAPAGPVLVPPVADEEDLQLTLWMLYELHYRGLEGVDPRWEWAPELAPLRRSLEDRFEERLRAAVGDRLSAACQDPRPVPELIFDLVSADDPSSVAGFARRRMSLPQWRELLTLRSIYQLKEADPHTWIIPRLVGPAKTAAMDIQHDEYGAGRTERNHAHLFAEAMEASGLSSRYAAYVDAVPAVVLAASNFITMCALQRRLVGAAAGHLAMFEATSSLPCKRYVAAAQRLGLPEKAWVYFDEHVVADAVHEQLAARGLCGTLVAQSPAEREQVLFGVLAGLWLEGASAAHQLTAWEQDRSALRRPGV